MDGSFLDSFVQQFELAVTNETGYVRILTVQYPCRSQGTAGAGQPT